MSMQVCYRGSVNRWECDENDHLNVRFYAEKHWQTLCGWLQLGPLAGRPAVDELVAGMRWQHLRFLRESRLATPLTGVAGVVDSGDDGLQVLTELRHSFSGEVLCSCLHAIAGVHAAGNIDLPEHARPRGVAPSDLGYVALSLHELADYGFAEIGAGVAQPSECLADGPLLLPYYMGRISDAMPHLWGELPSQEGGAVLEYRLRYHQPLRCHQAFTVRSGIVAVGSKVQQFAHMLFAADTGVLCASAVAAGVRMDLQARRALTLSDARQAQLRARQLQPLGT